MAYERVSTNTRAASNETTPMYGASVVATAQRMQPIPSLGAFLPRPARAFLPDESSLTQRNAGLVPAPPAAANGPPTWAPAWGWRGTRPSTGVRPARKPRRPARLTGLGEWVPNAFYVPTSEAMVSRLLAERAGYVAGCECGGACAKCGGNGGLGRLGDLELPVVGDVDLKTIGLVIGTMWLLSSLTSGVGRAATKVGRAGRAAKRAF